MTKFALIALITVLALAPVAHASSATGALVGAFNTTVEQAPSQTTDQTPSDPGVTASDILPGNGTSAGYILAHGNVISGSEWVSIGTRKGARNRDYTIDYASGTLFFTEPVPQMSSVQVDYRYSTQAQAERNVSAPGLVALRFGGNVQSKLLYSHRTGQAMQGLGTQDILTYGLNTMTKLGGASSLSSMFYVASPETVNRMSVGTMAGPPQAPVAKAKKDRIIVQDADLRAGKVRLKLGYQDIGKDFAGFSSLRDSKAAATDVLDQLEKEKGLRRMNIAGELPSGQNGGLNFGFSQIQDKTDEITSKILGYKGSGFAFNFSSRDVGKEFSRFTDIKEADRDQLAAEVGMSRRNIGMQFQTGATGDKKPVWSGINCTDLSGDSGSLTYRSAEVELGKIKVQADVRSMDNTFNRMNALSDDERSRMALMARRQFDPTAAASQVTAADKTQILAEQGLNRSTCIVQVDGSKMDTWLSLSNVDSAKGSLSRKAARVDAGPVAAYFNTQTVDSTFERLAGLQAVEIAHYGNEFGMTRTEMGGRLKALGSEMSVDTKTVIDAKGAGVFRQAINLKSSRFSIRANFQNIDPRFSRIMDLADTDKTNLVQDLGFKRSDYAISFQATKALSLESYVYDSTNVTAGQTRGQRKYRLSYAPVHGLKMSILSDDASYITENGTAANYSHHSVTFDHTLNMLGGITIKGRNETYSDLANNLYPRTTSVSQNHIESNPNAKISFTADIINTDYGEGRHDDTQSVGVKTAATRNMSLIGGVSTTTNDAGKSEANGRFGLEWGLNKDLKMTFSMANRNGGTKGGQQTSLFSINGPLAKRFLFLNNIVIASSSSQSALRGKQTICDNAFKVNAGFVGGLLTFDNTDKLNPTNGIYYTSQILQYESNKDPKQPWHLTIFKQNLTTLLGTSADKRNYALDYRLTNTTNLTFTSYQGKDGLNGIVIPTGGTVMKVSRILSNGMTMIADYTNDDNALTNLHARVFGCGIARTNAAGVGYELYYGWCDLKEGGVGEPKNIFRAKYDSKLDTNRYISFSLQRKSGVDKTTINPWEGDTVGRVDIKFLFH